MKRTALTRSTPLKKRPAKSAAKLRAEATALWGKVIHARDVYCQYCGKAGGKLDAHHIVRREFNATRTDETNGVLLCGWTCHRKIIHEDPFAAVQFYTRRLGVEGYEALRQKAYDGKDQRYGVDYWRNEIVRLRGLLEGLSND